MKKKYILIILLLTVLSMVVLYFYLSNMGRRATISPQEQWTIENQTPLAERALEEYFIQDKNESEENRNERLRRYFSPNSPVLNYELKEINKTSAERSTGRVLSIKDCEEQEGGDLCLLALSRITYFVGENLLNSETLTYWLTIQKSGDGSFKVYDLGVFE